MRIKFIIAAFFFASLLFSSGVFAKWDNTSISAGDQPNIDLNYTDEELTDIVFYELIRTTPSIGQGEAIFMIHNPFDQEIPLTIDLNNIKNEIASMTFYALEIVEFEEQRTVYRQEEVCDTKAANGSFCWFEDVIDHYETVQKSTEKWVEQDSTDGFMYVPAGYDSKIRVILKYNELAYGRKTQIDWVPKFCIDKGIFDIGGTCYSQKAWAWFNANWDNRIEVNVTCQDSGGCINEPINITTNGTEIRNSNGYPYAMRVTLGDSTEIPYMFVNISGNWTEGVEFLANSTTAGTTYYLYYNNTNAPDPTYSDCTSWSPCWEANSTKSFWVVRENFENNTVDWNVTTDMTINSTIPKRGNYAAEFSDANAGDMGIKYFNDSNATKVYFGWYEKAHLDTNNYAFNIQDGDFTNAINMQDDYPDGVIRYTPGVGWGALYWGTPNEWGTINGNTTLTLFNISRAGYYENYSLGVRGNPTFFDRFYIGQNLAAAGAYLVDNLYISTQNSFNLYNNTSIVTLGAEENVVYIGINNTLFNPVNNSQYAVGTNWTMWIEVCNISHGSGKAYPQEVNLSWNGGASTRIAANTSLNVSCINVSTYHMNLSAGDYDYNWTATDNNSKTVYSVGTFTVAQNRSNTVTISHNPSSSVDVGTSTTTTCSDTLSETLTLTKDGIVVANPYSATLSTGSYVFNCTSDAGANYTTNSTSSTLTVGAGATAGCSNNLTYAYKMQLNVTDNITTVIDLWSYRNSSLARPDLQDTHVTGNNSSIISINASRFLCINTTGLKNTNITIYWGNFLNNMSHTTHTASGATATDAIAGVEEYNNSVLLTFKNEENQTTMLMPDANMTLDFFCTGGHTSFTYYNGTSTSNWTSFLAATYSDWEKLSAKVEYTASDYYKRHRTVSTDHAEYTIWLPDATIASVQQTENEIFDTTSDFSTANLTVKKWIADSLEIIDVQFFDINNLIYFYGIEGDEYQFYISNGDETRTIGNLVIDSSSLSTTFIIQEADIGEFESLGEITRHFSYNNTSGIIRFYYNDPYEQTSELNMTVYFYGNNSQINFQQLTDTYTATMTYTVNDTTDKYKVMVMINPNSDIGAVTLFYVAGGIVGAITTTIPETLGYFWTRLAFVGIYFITILSFGARYAFEATLVGVLMVTVGAVINWLPLHPYVIVFLWLGVALWYIYRGVSDGQ